jgi:hypothetical protein
MLPPLAEPGGPRRTDLELVRDFVRGEPAGASPSYHIEGGLLVGGSSIPLALRIGEGSVLARRDVPEGVLALRTLAEEVLVTEGLSLLDEDTPLGIPAGIQLAGLRVATWDLWGVDIDQAYAYLRQAVAGDDPMFASDEGPGLTLDQLFGEPPREDWGP